MHAIYRTKQLILLLGDMLFLFIGIMGAFYIRRKGTPTLDEISTGLFWFSILIVLWMVVHYINGMYNIAKHRRKTDVYVTIIQSAVINTLVGVLFFYTIPPDFFNPKTILLLSILLGYSLLFFWHLLFSNLFANKRFNARLLFIGDTPEMHELAEHMYAHPERGYSLVAWISPHKQLQKEAFPHTTFYESSKAIRPSVSVHEIDTVVIAPQVKGDDIILRELYELLFWRTRIISMTSLYEILTGRIPPHTFSESWFLDHLQHASQPIYEHLRRIIDIIIGICLLLLCIALYPVLALLIRIGSPGPIIFHQARVGTGGCTFLLYKFRSMYALAADGSAETKGVEFAQKNDKRVTAIGKFLRKSRLDELPQAINLLKGDISLIGPRPERPEIVRQLEDVMPYYPVRHIIKPGITGWAQINQHYTDTIEQSLQKLQYDLYYIKNRSLLLDLSILLKTVNVVLRGMGQ